MRELMFCDYKKEVVLMCECIRLLVNGYFNRGGSFKSQLLNTSMYGEILFTIYCFPLE